MIKITEETYTGHHIDEQGRFQSDKYPELAPDKVVINLKHPEAWPGLLLIAQAYADRYLEFGEDLKARILQLRHACMQTKHQARSQEMKSHHPNPNCGCWECRGFASQEEQNEFIRNQGWRGK